MAQRTPSLERGGTVAYIRISKPVGGKVTVEYDAVRGPTRYRDIQTEVPVSQIPTVVAVQAAEYERRKAALKNAIKPVP